MPKTRSLVTQEVDLLFFVVNQKWQQMTYEKIMKACVTNFKIKSPPFALVAELELYGSVPSVHVGRLCRPHICKDVVGDGNCFFRCLSYLITGDEDNHFVIRRWIVSNMRSRDVCMPTSSYLEKTRMLENGVWATDIEIMAAARALKTDIFVFSRYGKQWKWMRFRAGGKRPGSSRRSVYLHHHRLSHFKIVFTVQNNSKPPIKNDSAVFGRRKKEKESETLACVSSKQMDDFKDFIRRD